MQEVQKMGRNSSVELLRVLCLVFIFWMHGAASFVDNGISAWISIAVTVIGNIGVSCFILISGYYGIRLDIKKMMHLDLMLVFYSWVGLILLIFWGERPGGEALLSHIFPVIGKQSWYFTCYFALAFLSPFLNELVDKFEELRLRQLLIVMLVIFSGVTTVFFFDINDDGGKGIVHMVMLYLIGRYLGVYQAEKKVETRRLICTFALIAGINFCLNGALYIVTGSVRNSYARDNTLFTVAEAVCIFLIFRNLYFENGFINRVAKCVPAVFMFEWTLRNLILHYVADVTVYAGENYYELLVLVLAIILVALGCLIDMVRVAVFSGVENWIVQTVYGAVEQIAGKRAKRGEKDG